MIGPDCWSENIIGIIPQELQNEKNKFKRIRFVLKNTIPTYILKSYKLILFDIIYYITNN